MLRELSKHFILIICFLSFTLQKNFNTGICIYLFYIMKLVHTVKDLTSAVDAARVEGKSIGLVPTMGALHSGHASLIKRCAAENGFTVISIFVNPTQFNDPKDLKTYPRTLDSDCKLAEEAGADLVFAPSVEEVYPQPDTRRFSYPPLDTVMEGIYRPGHFNGVCQIVSKLLTMVAPDRAYFGEKDFQQLAIIRAMVKDLKLPVEIVPCPEVREPSGLAISSRNALLSPEERKTAVSISGTLAKSLDYAQKHSIKETQKWVVETLNKIEGLKVQYFEIVDGNTLQSLKKWDDSDYIVGCITVYCGAKPIRLIDNIKYKQDN